MKKLLSLLFLIGSLRIGSAFGFELNGSNIATYCSTSNSVCNLSGKNITSIAPNTFWAYSNLSELYLRDNALTSISQSAFNGLSSLTLLSLSRNQITSIETGSFSPLTKLTELYLYSNPISIFEAGVFSGLAGLEKLYLYSGAITGIATGVLSDLPNLSFLDLHGNTISTINALHLSGLNSLEELDLGTNQLTGIDNQDISSFAQLKRIYLNNNNISNINGSDFSGLSNLEIINLGINKIDKIPTGFSLLPKLNQLVLSKNLITGLNKEDFIGLTGLINLILDDNQIQYIESGTFLPLQLLDGIWLNNNPITGINIGTFNGLENLYQIYLGGTQITYIEEGSFSSLKNLGTLDLYRISGGCVDNVTSRTFEGPTRLGYFSFCTSNLEIGALSGKLSNGATLSIHGTNGLNLASGAFGGINPDIISLDFYSCSNCNIEEGVFNNMTNVRNLYIYGSANIGHGFISPNLFNNLYNLTILRVNGNFTGITLGSFSNLDKLNQLELRGQIENIESQTFQGLNNLTELDLGTNNISLIKSGTFSQMPLLSAIHLGRNKIKEIELGAFSGIQKKLAVLFLNNNNISLDVDIVNYLNSVANTIYSGDQHSYITYTPNESTSGPVVATVHLINGDLITNNGAKNTYTFTTNGTFDFKIEQTNGYRGYHRATVTWITGSTNPPQSNTGLQTTGTISYSTTSPTTSPVVATLNLSSGGTITSIGGSTHTFNQNGSFTFTFADTAGNTGSAIATVSWISTGSGTVGDTTLPIGTISYSPSSDTEVAGNVVATISLNEPGSITSAGGATHTFTSNGDFLFEFQDSAGNKSSTTASVDWIINTFAGKTINNTLVKNNGIYNADIKFSFNNNNGVVATLDGVKYKSGTLISSEGLDKEFLLTDQDGYTTGLIFSIDKTVPTCLVSNTATLSGTYLNLEWECSDNLGLSGLTVTINDANNNLLYTTGLNASSTNLAYYNDSGTYKWKIIATDKAGNKSTMTYQQIEYTKSTSIKIQPSGNLYDDVYYISGYNAILTITGNTWFGFKIIGDLTSTIAGSYTTGILNQNITLDNGEGMKNIIIDYINANGYGKGSLDPISFYVDTSTPTITDSYPTNLLNATGSTMTFKWSATDTGVGISGYVLEITKSTWKPTLVYLGGTSTSYTLTKMSNGTYTWKVKAIDYAGNTKETDYSTFILGSTATSGDTSPDSFSINKEYDADLDEEYESEIITVAGLSSGTKVLAYVSEGSLIINGNDIGTTGYVQNDDEVQIAIYSSEEYDDLTSGVLTIGDQSSTFKIITISEDDNSTSYTITSLSSSEKLNLSLVYNALLNIYDEDEQDDFMLSFKYIVKDKIEAMVGDDEDEIKIEKMKYLYNVINKNFKGEDDNTIIDATTDDSSSNSDEKIKHTAPNGKEYTITYDDKGYTSSNFLKSGKYFDSLTEIKTYINKNNPKSPYRMIDFTIDTSWNQSYTAPNGKKYVLFKTTDGRYGSNSFIYGKTFTSLGEIQAYIYKNNR